ncbi:hypothetical protein M514_06602 [Trichuris suis]|uniref:Uncharacterized protein n=1 Tax=Trichuris suis TaxID=68888 RepID=A0A085M5S2_9BILA|nr:hypothetical protein M513_06602 [Trichuris suis]KFD63684.1 hypothetical protein M514_06602 [Trichuris suis]
MIDPIIDVDEFSAEFSKYNSTLREVCNLFADILTYTEGRVSLLHRFASKIEKLFDEFLQCDPDLFDDQLMATIPETNDFKILIMELRSHPHVMERIFCVDLLEEDLSEDLYSAAARICMTIAPFVHLKAFAEHENIMSILFKHAKSEHVELQTYALGLLSAMMNYMEYEGLENDRVSLARIVLQRLSAITGSPDDVVSAVSVVREDGPSVSTIACSNTQCQNGSTNDTAKESMEASSLNFEESAASSSEAKSYANGNNGSEDGVRPKGYSLHPLTVDIRHRVILCFLAHEWGRSSIIPYAVEANLVEKLYTYLDENAAWNPWTVLNAIRCLEAMFSHPKVARVFVANDGVHRLLRIKPDTLPGTAIPAALCQLAQQGEAMESMCMMSHGAFRELIEYIVRVLECSHESARYDAADFLAMCFGFRRPLEHFDSLHGLRAICNNLGRIRENAQNASLTDGNYSLVWNNMARCFGTALKRYLEAHMLQKLEQLQQSSPALWSKQARRYHNIERTFVNEVGTIAEPQVSCPFKVAVAFGECKSRILHELVFQTLFSDRDFARECVTFLRENCSHCLDWYPIKELRRNDTIQVLIGLIDDCLTKLTVSSCQDCLSAILTVLWYASVSPVVQFDLTYTPHGEVRRNLFRYFSTLSIRASSFLLSSSDAK